MLLSLALRAHARGWVRLYRILLELDLRRDGITGGLGAAG